MSPLQREHSRSACMACGCSAYGREIAQKREIACCLYRLPSASTAHENGCFLIVRHVLSPAMLSKSFHFHRDHTSAVSVQYLPVRKVRMPDVAFERAHAERRRLLGWQMDAQDLEQAPNHNYKHQYTIAGSHRQQVPWQPGCSHNQNCAYVMVVGQLLWASEGDMLPDDVAGS